MSTAITSPELESRLRSEPGLTLIDVRTNAEFETVHIPDSHSIPLALLQERAAELAALDGPIVLVCQSGARSQSALETLQQAGKTDLSSLDGGLIAWQSSGGDTAVGSSGTWAMDRQVRLVAGSLVLSGILASIAVPKAKWLAGGIGTGLVYSAVSNTCTMGDVLSMLPYNQTEGYDVDEVLQQLQSADATSS